MDRSTFNKGWPMTCHLTSLESSCNHKDCKMNSKRNRLFQAICSYNTLILHLFGKREGTKTERERDWKERQERQRASSNNQSIEIPRGTSHWEVTDSPQGWGPAARDPRDLGFPSHTSLALIILSPFAAVRMFLLLGKNRYSALFCATYFRSNKVG